MFLSDDSGVIIYCNGYKAFFFCYDKRKKVSLRKLSLSEGEISKRAHVSKTAAHLGISKFSISVKFTYLKRSGLPSKTSAGVDHAL